MNVVFWIVVVLRGAGQIMFQENAGTGLLFLIGIALASPLMALGGLVGTALGTLTAQVLRYHRKDIEDGLYGFNASLVAIAVWFFHPLSTLSLVLLILGCTVSTPVAWLMRRYCRFPAYTAPFIITTWIVLGLAKQLQLPEYPPAKTIYHPLNLFAAVFEGMAEVMFQANVHTGFLFLLAIAVNNWRHAIVAFLGTVVGSLLSVYHNDPSGAISIGIYGYNSALAAMAVYLWRRSLLLPILAAVVATIITEFFPFVRLPTLTAPFVLASWAILAVGRMELLFCKE
jgi:urea transporter